MKRARPTPAPTPKTLGEQKSDFTAEGAPPPGHVGTETPVGIVDAATPGLPATAKRMSTPPEH
ncbi:MAG: hypothetical protein KA387_04100 [Rubrivivax sp.]|nr:hypothetical protein [Rubrivivax sp.]